MASAATELLFSYGTLQLEPVQRALFDRTLDGTPDRLPGFEQAMLEIDDPTIVALSGKTHHTIVAFTGRTSDAVAGTVYRITQVELQTADAYEVAEYRRISARLHSGLDAWVYVDARHAPPGA